jgi:tetrahedral aminopeptidase
MAGASSLLARLAGLCSTAAPSGREDELRALVADRWRPFVTEPSVDALGNLLARVGASGPRVLVTAHLDEIGWVVRHITQHGFLLLDTAQGARNAGPEPRHMVGHAALVLGRDGVAGEGVVAAASGHVLTKEQVEAPVADWDDFFVDVGVNSAAEAQALGVYVGSPVVFRTTPRAVGRRIVGTAMDDRVCLAAIELLLESVAGAELEVDLHVAATVQEENGLHGAHALARAQRFDRVVALDVGLVGDIPTVGETRYAGRLGAGPIVVHKDARVAYDHALSWQLSDCADGAGISWQHGVFAGYGSDGVPFVQAGMPTALLCVPTRYTHSPFEMIDPDDVDALVRLLTAWVSR